MGHGGDGAGDAAVLEDLEASGLTIDRSKMHILLCDKDSDTACHVMLLLQKCSYKVTAVKSAGQVLAALDPCCDDVDLILTEVELPKEKGFKMLKHIVRQKQFQRIPVVMMSARDEMAVIVKCLRLGAVDYLLKPLRTNELLNLWTHTWRRRRMLGLAEKHFVTGKVKVPFDILVSETSESNKTNSTNLFSDDTDDLKRVISTHGGNNFASREMQSEMSPQLELSLKPSLDLSTEVSPEHALEQGLVPSPPKKSLLKMGKSSAFLSYAKVSNQSADCQVKGQSDTEAGNHTTDSRPYAQSCCPGNDSVKVVEERKQLSFSNRDNSSGLPPEDLCSGVSTYTLARSNSYFRSVSELGEGDCSLSSSWNDPYLSCELAGTSLASCDQLPLMQVQDIEGDFCPAPLSSAPASHFVNGRNTTIALPAPASFVSPSMHLCHGLPSDGGVAAGIPTMHGLTPSHGLPLSSPFSFYHFGLPPAAHQGGSYPGWPSVIAAPMMDHKLGQAERREAALDKFRRKRKDRCFRKKIRYVSRKKLAEQRPRVRGQFVRRVNDTDLNDNGVLVDEYDEEDEEDQQDSGDVVTGSSPESIAEES